MVYAGTEPAALYRSEDRGETFELVRPLWEHPTRSTWVPGGGVERPAHSRHRPADAAYGDRRLHGGSVSFTTTAEQPGSRPTRGFGGLPARPGPGVRPVRAQGRAGRRDPDRLYLQNHWGVYRSDDAGATWTTSARACRPPSVSQSPPIRTARHTYVFPITADADRVPAEHKCRVFRTGDAGPELGAAVGRAAAGASTTARCCATHSAPMTRTRPGCISAIATARCIPVRTTATAGSRSPRICRTCCAYGLR